MMSGVKYVTLVCLFILKDATGNKNEILLLFFKTYNVCWLCVVPNVINVVFRQMSICQTKQLEL